MVAQRFPHLQDGYLRVRYRQIVSFHLAGISGTLCRFYQSVNPMKNHQLKAAGLFAIIACCVLIGCKGYDEGPFFSIYTAEDRVKNTWKWASAREDGINLTGILADSTIEFADSDVVKICAKDGGCREGIWTLISKNEELQIIFGKQAIAYQIERLTRKELWLKYQDTLLIEWQLQDLSE